jgi:hypothetical protein
MKRRLTMGDLYELVSGAHRNLFDRDGWPDIGWMDSDYLDEIRRGLWGSRKAVDGLLGVVTEELSRRGVDLQTVVPLRPVEVYDPLKHDLEGA